MRGNSYDVVVIGGGPAGMASALAAREDGASVLVLERNHELGGILRQCIHPGFGLSYFKEELTGPEYAQRFIDRVAGSGIDTALDAMVTAIDGAGGGGRADGEGTRHAVTFMSPDGMRTASASSVVLAMGCRERTRSEIRIPGTRPAGVFTAGLAQRYINIENYAPGSRFVILGSGDIGLIMARRLTLEGFEVEGVYELMPYANGLARNVRNCLDDFGIPLHLSTTVTRVIGSGRLEAVEVSRVDEERRPIPGTQRTVPCDALLLSVGLIPENELSSAAGVRLDPRTNGAEVDESLETSVPGIFSCGNVLHVHDLADNVTVEATRAGKAAARHAAAAPDPDGEAGGRTIRVSAGGLASYVTPARVHPHAAATCSFRVKRPVDRACVRICVDGREVRAGKPRSFKPSVMESYRLPASIVEQAERDISLSIVPVEEAPHE